MVTFHSDPREHTLDCSEFAGEGTEQIGSILLQNPSSPRTVRGRLHQHHRLTTRCNISDSPRLKYEVLPWPSVESLLVFVGNHTKDIRRPSRSYHPLSCPKWIPHRICGITDSNRQDSQQHAEAHWVVGQTQIFHRSESNSLRDLDTSMPAMVSSSDYESNPYLHEAFSSESWHCAYLEHVYCHQILQIRPY